MKMGEEAMERVFILLKPLCDQLAKKPDAQIAKTLSDTINRCSESEIAYYIEFIVFPVYLHLNNDSLNKEIKCRLVDLLRTILSKAKIKNINYFFKFYTTLLLQIYDNTQQSMLIPLHEEFKESVVKCLKHLVRSSFTDLIQNLYVRQNAAKLSQGVYTCLSIAKTEKLISLRVAALEALMALSHVDDEADPNDLVLRAQIADILMFFLPGIAHGLYEIALGSDLQHHTITMLAVRAFGRIVTLVMEDQPDRKDVDIESILRKQNVQKPLDPLGNLLKLEGNKGMEKHLKTTMRNEEWLEAASTKLNGLIQSLSKLVRHSHPQVRKELALAVKLLLEKCSRNMASNFIDLVEILISLSEDESEEIKELSCLTLNDINNKFSSNFGMRSIVELLEENFYKLLTKLPRLIRRSGDSEQLSYLNQLAGYIKLLGKQRLPYVMASVPHLQRLLLALVYVAELDYSHVSVLEDIQIKDIETSDDSLQSWKRFKFIRDTMTEKKLVLVCKLLGELGDLTLLVDSILDLMSEMHRYRKELTFILNCVSTVEDPSMSILHKQIIDYYVDPENWCLPIDMTDNVTLGDVQNNIIICCLLIEGLGNIAMNIREEYNKYLLKTLYLVIERAGSGNSFISQVGMKGLEQIAQSQNYENVAELLRENVDYISYHVTMKMRRIESNPGVLDVFSIIMKYTTMDVVPCLQGVVEDALKHLSNNYLDRNSYSYLKVLYIFTLGVRKLMKFESTEEKVGEKLSKAEKVVRSILEYQKAKEDSENIEEEVEVRPEDIEKEIVDRTAEHHSAYENEEEERKIEVPHHIKMIEDVMKCCLNFLPSKDVPKSLLAMQILEEGFHILSNWSEQLLPLVHQTWHPLVDRFQDSNILIINRAWQLLYKLSQVSEDFIRSRTLKQILPSLSRFLVKSAKESYKKDSKNAYKYTQMYKLQKTLLAEGGVVARNLKLQERQLWQILDTTQSYLSSNQHPSLQESCVQLFKDVASCNADIVWIKCLAIWNRHVATIPVGYELTVENLKSLKTGDQEYLKNVEEILIWIEAMDVIL